LLTADAASEVTRNPQFTVVSILSPQDLPTFDAYAKIFGATVAQELRAEVKHGVPFAYAISRPPHAMAYILVANDATSMDALADALIARQEPLQGVMR